MADVGGVAGDRLRAFIERIERLEEERVALSDDIREVYAEAKATGFDPKIMRQLVRLRKMESSDREEQEYLLDTYKAALGMIALPPQSNKSVVPAPQLLSEARTSPEA